MSILWQIAYTKGNATTRKTSFGASAPATAAMGAAAHKGAGVFPGRFGNERVERSAFHGLGAVPATTSKGAGGRALSGSAVGV